MEIKLQGSIWKKKTEGIKMRVKSITYAGKSDVYNMEVEGTHDFAIENGIIAHNCYDESRYFLMTNPIKSTRKPPKPHIPSGPLDY